MNEVMEGVASVTNTPLGDETPGSVFASPGPSDEPVATSLTQSFAEEEA